MIAARDDGRSVARRRTACELRCGSWYLMPTGCCPGSTRVEIWASTSSCRGLSPRFVKQLCTRSRGSHSASTKEAALQWNWDRAGALAERAIAKLLLETLALGSFWNVNLPDPGDDECTPELRHSPLNPLHLLMHFDEHDGGVRYTGNYHDRPRTPGDDVDVCFSGDVAITEMSVW